MAHADPPVLMMGIENVSATARRPISGVETTHTADELNGRQRQIGGLEGGGSSSGRSSIGRSSSGSGGPLISSRIPSPINIHTMRTDTSLYANARASEDALADADSSPNYWPGCIVWSCAVSSGMNLTQPIYCL